MTAVATRPARAAGWRQVSLGAALTLGDPDWARATAAAATPFQWAEWYRAWYAVASPADRSSALVLARSDDEGNVVGMVPLAHRVRRVGPGMLSVLTWPSEDFGCPDHLDLPLAHDREVDGAIEQLTDMDWDLLVLGNLAEGAPRALRLAAALGDRGYHVDVRRAEPCPRLSLPGSWDEYLATQSATRRQTIRRKERKLEKKYQVTVRHHDANSFDDGWRILCALHSDRWSGTSAFSQPVAVMHREFARGLAARGNLWLTTLELDGVPAAAWYGFTGGESVYFYQSGRSLQFEGDSVGQVLMGKMIQRAIAEGFREFDFLRGDEPYKADWTRDRRTTWELVVARPGRRGLWPRACRAAAVARRRERARIKRLLAALGVIA